MPEVTVLFIVGPTAIGKTALSLKLAKMTGGEIVSADSMQAYKGMRILSQAPDASDRKRIKHHLVEFLDPRKEYNASIFSKRAAFTIDSIIRRKKVPIVAGGSGLYVKALVDGLFPSRPADEKFRARMQNLAAKYGPAKLHKKLAKIDPEAACKIHPNDARRIIRALEIHHSTGRTMTELKSETRGLSSMYRIKMFGLTAPRGEIYANIEARVDRMLDEGLVVEVRRLKKKKLSRTAGAVLGYKEIAGYLDGKYDIETAVSLMKMNTRRFAKRQLAWFGSDRRIKWFDVTKVSETEMVNSIQRSVCQFASWPVSRLSRQTGKPVNR